MKYFLISIMILLSPVYASSNESQAVWSKNEETDTKKCQLAIEKGVSVNLKTSKSLERTAYLYDCLLYTSPSPRDKRQSRMPSSA